MQLVDSRFAQQIVKGASFFGTGGGLSIKSHLARFAALFEKRKVKHLLASLDELEDEAFVCTAYALGSAASTEFNLAPAFKNAMSSVRRYAGRDISAIFPGESNIEALAFEVAAELRVPVLDADSTGGRAVPEIRIDNCFLCGCQPYPLIGAALDGSAVIIESLANAEHADEMLRGLAKRSQAGAIAVFSHLMSVKQARQILTLGTISRAQALAQQLDEISDPQKKLEALVRTLGATVLAEGKVSRIGLHDQAGFLQGSFGLRDRLGRCFDIFVKNENILLVEDSQVVSSSPELIIAVDRSQVLGVHNSEIYLGQEIVVMSVKATEKWQSPEAQELFSPISCGIGVALNRAPQCLATK